MLSSDFIQALVDKHEIVEVIGPRYGRALDWLDEAALKECFHADGWVDYGFFVGNAHDWCAVVLPIERQSVHRFHYTFNPLVDIHGDRADAESNSVAGARMPNGAGGFNQSFYGSRYLDKLERRDGRWKILERRVLLEFAQQLPSAGSPDGSLKGLELVSGFSSSHPLYRRMTLSSRVWRGCSRVLNAFEGVGETIATAKQVPSKRFSNTAS